MSVFYKHCTARSRPERMVAALVALGFCTDDELREALFDTWPDEYIDDVIWQAEADGHIWLCDECREYRSAYVSGVGECCEVRDASFYGVAHLFGAAAL